MRAHRVLSTLILGLALAACSGSEGGPTDSGVHADATQPAMDADLGTGDALPDAGFRDAEPSPDAEPRDVGSADAAPCVGPTGTVTLTGSSGTTFVSATGAEVVPDDLTASTLQILAATGPNECFATYPVAGTAEGTFSATQLPAGVTYYLQYTPDPPNYLVTTATDLDLGYAVVGRATGEYPTAETLVTLDLTGLDTWQAEHDLEISAVNAGAFAFFVPGALTPSPVVGATTLAGTLAWDAVAAPVLIDAAQGDVTTVAQLVPRTPAGGETYLALSKALTLDTVTIADAQGTTIAGALAAPARSATVSIDWRRAAFAAAGAEMPASAQRGDFNLYVVSAAAASYGLAAPTPDFVEMSTTTATDLLQDFTFGDPYGEATPKAIYADLSYSAGVSLGSASPAAFDLAISAELVIPGGGGPVVVQPIVGPARALRVNGRDANVDVSGVGASPTLAWSAPSLGTAGGYRVVLYQLTRTGQTTRRVMIAGFRTTATELKIPEGLMVAGRTYVFEIMTYSASAGVDYARRPFGNELPDGFASTITARIMP